VRASHDSCEHASCERERGREGESVFGCVGERARALISLVLCCNLLIHARSPVRAGRKDILEVIAKYEYGMDTEILSSSGI